MCTKRSYSLLFIVISAYNCLFLGVKLKILVGQMGTDATAYTFTLFSKEVPDADCGGGGGSFVTTENNTPLIIAGGGGGVFDLSSIQQVCHGSVSTSGNPGYGGGAWPGGKDGQGASTAGSSYSGGGGGEKLNGAF